ncbi:hypothetical protein AB5N19_03517 [Seiridium cardinale]|uniref:Uncharacterized protein n=1 Tax=Seiridium cardinale TaxID=138064 RepID=A0ABR2Y2B9_9PEZI
MKFFATSILLFVATVNGITITCGDTCSNGTIGLVNFQLSSAPVPDTCQTFYITWEYCTFVNDSKGDKFSGMIIYGGNDDSCSDEDRHETVAPGECPSAGLWARARYFL